MVAYITTGDNIYGALSYNQEKVDKGLGNVLEYNNILEPEEGKYSVTSFVNIFNRWLPSHFKTEKPVIHISLNPHPDDKLTDDQLVDIANEYMEKMGWGEQPYIIFKHKDIKREHIHIVGLQVDRNGTKINDSKRNERSVAVTEDLERKYGLHVAKEQKSSEKWKLSSISPEQGDIKAQIASVTKSAILLYHFQTMGEYRALLSLYNIGFEEVRGERKGHPYKGLLYFGLDKDGEKSGSPLKSSLFGKSVGLDNLEKLMANSGEKIKSKRITQRLKPIIAEALRNSSTESKLRKKLKEKNIDLYIRRNDNNRITGVTFISHTDRCVLNGSRLGKEFSANVFNNLYGNQNIKSESPITLNPPKSKGMDLTKNIGSSITDAASLFSIFSPEQHQKSGGDIYEKKRRKKKPRYGRQV